MATETERRDQLALDRTLLAAERTMLAYVRTSLALIGGGIGLTHFVDAPGATAGGWLCLGIGALVFPFGIWRYVSVRRRVARP